MDAEQLKAVLNNPAANASQRQAALDALAAMGEKPYQPAAGEVSEAVSPVAIQLLRSVNTSSFADVTEQDVYDFLNDRGARPDDRETLFREFLAYKINVERDPAYVAGRDEIRRRLLAYFNERQAGFMARLKAAIDAGESTKPIREEIIEFYRDWVDSCVLRDEVKAHMREVIGG